MKSLNDFYEGLRSMGPVGLWLPWSEVVELAGRCGWSGQDCGVAANICCGLQAVELDPRDGDERPAGPSQYRRVRVLPTQASSEATGGRTGDAPSAASGSTPWPSASCLWCECPCQPSTRPCRCTSSKTAPPVWTRSEGSSDAVAPPLPP